MFHLVKRFFGSLSTSPLDDVEQAWVKDILTVREQELWSTQAIVDQRHSYDIGRRFVIVRPQASRDEIAGALLHDVGKIDAGLGIVARVIATALPLPTTRFSAYRHHQQRGADMLRVIGCSEQTIALVAGHPDSDALHALSQADDI
jgi:hypothetical protein